MSKDTISVNMNVYDIPIVVEQLNKLEQENKQLKGILTELEEWLKEEKERYYGEVGIHQKLLIEDIIKKIQELKEKCK